MLAGLDVVRKGANSSHFECRILRPGDPELGELYLHLLPVLRLLICYEIKSASVIIGEAV